MRDCGPMRRSAKIFHMSDFDELARSLREGVGQDWREEAAADESLTELQRRRHTTLAETLRLATAAGHRIVIWISSRAIADSITGIGADHVECESDDGTWIVRIASARFEIVRTPSGGASIRSFEETFRARLAEIEMGGTPVEVVTSDGGSHHGAITVLATDHIAVTMESEATTLVPLELVAAVLSRPSNRIR